MIHFLSTCSINWDLLYVTFLLYKSLKDKTLYDFNVLHDLLLILYVALLLFQISFKMAFKLKLITKIHDGTIFIRFSYTYICLRFLLLYDKYLIVWLICRTTLKHLCDTMKTQIISRAFYGCKSNGQVTEKFHKKSFLCNVLKIAML